MPSPTPWIIFSIAVLLILLVALLIWKIKKGKNTTPDYRMFFIFGCIWLPLGIATENTAFWIMGLAFLIIGLANRKKWKKQTKLTPRQRNIQIALVIIGTVVLAALVIYTYFFRMGCC